ncbi:MAG: hypothetical protein KatS3mg014_1499 [Actinomycetota bacterium]|nr:MAG: hypothetical protein KatS3mg014_1499 [Actinomycetota bacterium]
MNRTRPGLPSSMKTFSVTPARARRTASARVSSIVRGTGGQEKNDRSPSRWAVGSPSVTMITCRAALGCSARSRPARWNAWCMFVPYTRSNPGAARSRGSIRLA